MTASYTKYVHHGKVVFVRKDLKGLHQKFCLCYQCARFKPGQPDNCEIAQAVFGNCVKFGIVTPLWECPVFERGEPQFAPADSPIPPVVRPASIL